MKSKWMIVFVSLATWFTYQSCDYVRSAPENFTVKTPGDRKILVEDYTGHKCGNCPAAADQLKKLDSIYKGMIIPIAVHAGFYAVPAGGIFALDIRSSAGTTWDGTFGNSQAGNPNGFVNRFDYGKSNFIKQHTFWGSSAAGVYSDSAYFGIGITNTYNTSTNQLTSRISCKGKKLKTGIYNLSVIIVEDSILGSQIDYRMNISMYPNQIDSHYVFNHVMRGAVNTTWGEQVFSGTVLKNDSTVKMYSNFQFSAAWKYKHCRVVAFIYDADPTSPTYYEIMQAAQKEVY